MADEGKISLTLSVVNLIKNIVGTSILAASNGVAHSGVVPSIVICIIFAIISGLTFGLMGVLSGEGNPSSYRGVCERYIHPKSGVWIDLLMAFYTFPACIAYSVFLCDCVQVMLLGLSPAAADEFYSTRYFICIVVTFGVLLPLCWVSQFQKLTFTSLIGLAAIIYCYIFVSIDLAKNAAAIDASRIVQNALWWPPSGSVLGLFHMADIYASCFVVQYNAAKFFSGMKNPTTQRFFKMSLITNAIVVLFCASFAVLGFARFGPATPDNLLVGYSGAYAVWIATCVSVVSTYPFVFDAGRNSFISALEGFKMKPKTVFWATTLFWVPLLSLSAIFITSLSFIVGLSGCICGMTVGFTLPGLVLANRARMNRKPIRRIAMGYILMITGIFLTVVGLVSIFVNPT